MSNKSGYYVEDSILRKVIEELVAEGFVTPVQGDIIRLKILVEQIYLAFP